VAVSVGGEKSEQARKKFGQIKFKNERKTFFFSLPPLTAPGSPRMTKC